MVAVITILISIIIYAFSKYLLSTSARGNGQISGDIIVNKTNVFPSAKGDLVKSNQ